MVAAIREDLKRKYRVREGIDGLGLALARNLFDRLEALEEPICYILDQYQEDRHRTKGYLKALEEEFEFAAQQGILVQIS